MSASIILREVSKRYPGADAWALHDVSLTIAEGEIFSLLGANGAGKTTLIAILGGLFPPTSGAALVMGHDVAADPLGARRCLGVVPEEVALYPQLSARRNLHYFGQLYGLGGRELARAVEEALNVAALTERADERVSRLSSGMKRRLNIAVALLHRPAVLLMDEPTVGLDPENRRRILDLVRWLKQERGTTILYTTHYMDEAEVLSDRVGILHRGRLLAVDTPAGLLRLAGADETLELVVDGPPPADALAALAQAPGVQGVALADGVLRVAAQDAATVLPTVMRLALPSDGRPPPLALRSLTVTRPRLEDVFLRLTGETLAEAP